MHEIAFLASSDFGGKLPAGVGKPRALEYREGRLEPDGRGRGGILEEFLEGAQRGGGELDQAVLDVGREFAAGVFEGGLERRRSAEPVVDRGAMQAGGSGGLGDSGALGEGGNDLGLFGRERASKSR